MPERIKLTEEEPWRSEGIHRMRVRNYYVYFWIDDENDRVQVTSVIYVARDQAAQLILMQNETRWLVNAKMNGDGVEGDV